MQRILSRASTGTSARKGRLKKAFPPMNKNGDLVSTDKENAEVLNNFLPQSSLATSLLGPPKSMDHKMGNRRVKPLSL